MKKLLALVLALVMTLGLATVSASAKTFADDADITYKEAVDVLSGVGVLSGMGENKFAPKEELTRAQAAKIIAYLDLGETAAENLPASKTFSDVPADHWASKYIAYCYSAGIVGGVGNGKFDPDAKLTGYAFGKMLLVVLGYDTKIEGFSGNDWMINVASVMNTANIGEDVEKAGTLVLTREEAAEYALDALKADVVKYDNKGTTINTTDGTSVVVGSSKAEAVERNNEGANNYAGGADGTDGLGYQQLCEKRYGTDLKLRGNDEDDFGRPSSGKWTYKNNDITDNVVKTKDLVFSSTKKVTYSDVYNALGSKVFNDNAVIDLSIWVDGVEISAATQENENITKLATLDRAEIKANKSSTKAVLVYDSTIEGQGQQAHFNRGVGYEITGNGVLTEIYKEDVDANEYNVTVVVINTWLAQASEDYDSSDKEITIELVEKTPATTYVGNTPLVDAPALDTLEIEDFAMIESLKEDDYVLVTVADGDVKSVALPQIVKDAKVSVYKNEDSLTAGGTSYSYAKIAAEIDGTPSVSDEYNLILDANGYLVGIEDADDTNSSSDYVYIKKVAKSGFNYQAELVFLSDGTKKTVTIASIFGEDVEKVYAGAGESTEYVGASIAKGGALDADDDGEFDLASGMFATYKVKSNGEYKLEYVATAKANGTIDYSKYGVHVFGTDDVASDETGNTKTVLVAKNKAYTGVKNFPKVNAGSVYYTLNEDGYFDAMYIGNEGKTTADKDEYVFILDADDFSSGEDADENTFYVYDAVVDGKKVDYTVNEDSETEISKPGNGVGLYIVDTYDGDYPELKAASEADDDVLLAVAFYSYNNGTVALDKNYDDVADASYTLASGAVIRTIDLEDDNEVKSIGASSMDDRANTKGFNTLFVVLTGDPDDKDSEIQTIYMVKGLDL